MKTKRSPDRCQACGAGVVDAATLCRPCVEGYRADLLRVAWLAPQLDITCSRQRSPRYSPLSKANATSPEPDWQAVSARAELRKVLASSVRYCHRHHLRSRGVVLPSGHQNVQARWLSDCADRLALDPRGAEVVHNVAHAVIRANAAVDLRPERQYLGACPACGEGAMYAERGATLAECRACGATVSAEALRAHKLDELDDRLCSAAEIADLSTYLGLRANREQVRKRINAWHSRGTLTAVAHVEDDARFRFGVVWRMLAADDARRPAQK